MSDEFYSIWQSLTALQKIRVLDLALGLALESLVGRVLWRIKRRVFVEVTIAPPIVIGG